MNLLSIILILSIFLSADSLRDQESEIIITTRLNECVIHVIDVPTEQTKYLLFSTLVGTDNYLYSASVGMLEGDQTVLHCTADEWSNASATILYEIP